MNDSSDDVLPGVMSSNSALMQFIQTVCFEDVNVIFINDEKKHNISLQGGEQHAKQ